MTSLSFSCHARDTFDGVLRRVKPYPPDMGGMTRVLIDMLERGLGMAHPGCAGCERK